MSRLIAPRAARVADAATLCALLVVCVLLAVASAAPVGRVAASEATSRVVLARAPSPTAGVVAFVRGKEERYSDIYAADVDGSKVRRLTRGPGFKYDPDWSPDGLRLLYRYEPPAGKRTVSGGLVAPMNWAPSKWLIFACDRPGGIGTCAQFSTGRRTQRLLGGAEGGFPAWRP
ncbi:MAG: TolB family protein [Gaiellaceae bacterium]